MLTYTIPQGTTILRCQYVDNADTAFGRGWKKIITSKEVTYDDNDIPVSRFAHDTERWMEFVLPSEARPWTRIVVYRHLVVVSEV